jgi:hypothetical protein
MSDERNRAKEGHPPHTLPNLPVQTGGVHVTGRLRRPQGWSRPRDYFFWFFRLCRG